MISNRQCEAQLQQTRLGYDFKLHNGFLCAGGEEGKDACKVRARETLVILLLLLSLPSLYYVTLYICDISLCFYAISDTRPKLRNRIAIVEICFVYLLRVCNFFFMSLRVRARIQGISHTKRALIIIYSQDMTKFSLLPPTRKNNKNQ